MSILLHKKKKKNVLHKEMHTIVSHETTDIALEMLILNKSESPDGEQTCDQPNTTLLHELPVIGRFHCGIKGIFSG